MTSYWWKSSDGSILRLSDDPYTEVRELYKEDSGGAFGILFDGGAKLTVEGEDEEEFLDTVAAWIKFAENKK